MKFKLVENYDQTRNFVQEYAYEVIEELGNASLEEYIQWFMSEFTYFDDEVKQAVKDFYIEAIDCGKIDLPKTMITSELTTYLESNVDLIDKNIDDLINNCPAHLKHELTLVLDKIDDSLTESVLEEAIRPDLKRYIEQNAELLDKNNIEELYKQCPRELKIPLVRMLNAASLSDNIESIKRATYLADNYDDEELIDLALSVTHHVNDVFDAFDYIMNNWSEFFADDMLNEQLLTEKLWVKVQDNTGLSNPFYFYATHKNTLKDVNTLLPIIKNKQKGTYKQQLNQDIVKELQSNYNKSSKKYILKIVSSSVSDSELAAMKSRIITISDRDLRKQAEQDVIVSTNLDPKHYLIHHKHRGEENNNLSNIMLVSRSSGDAAAHAVHKLLEFQGPAVRVGSTTVPIFEHNGTNWIQTFTVDITIR